MKRLFSIALPIVLLSGLILWRMGVKNAEAAAQQKQREMRKNAVPIVDVAPVALRDIVHQFEGTGTVEAPLNVKIAPKITGRLEFLQAHEGDRVTAGQVVARIDSTQVEADVRQAMASVAEAQQRLAQAEFGKDPNSVSVSTAIVQQRAEVESARADYKQVQENYKSQVAAAQAAVTDAAGRVNNADAGIRNAEASVRSAQANLENAKARNDRIAGLYKQGFIAAQDVDDAKTTVSVQEGALDVAKAQLNAAKALKDSAVAQKSSAQKQADIVSTKGVADIAASMAKLKQAQAALEYAKANVAQKPAYQANISALKFAVDAAKQGLQSAEARRSDTVLLSPINGFVTGRFMDPGSTATPGEPILALQAIQSVWVTVPIPEEVSRKVYLGQSADVKFDAIPGRLFVGKIVQVNPSADPQSRQFAARVSLDNPENLIKPGMFAKVLITTDRLDHAVAVPREAIENGPHGSYVLSVDEESNAHQIPVTPGAADAEYVAVPSGLQPGQNVIVMTAIPVKDGAKVRISGKSNRQDAKNGTKS